MIRGRALAAKSETMVVLGKGIEMALLVSRDPCWVYLVTGVFFLGFFVGTYIYIYIQATMDTVTDLFT